MKIHINAEVFCGEKYCGKVSYVIVDPINYELTHFVVTESHFPLRSSELLVSIKHVVESDSEKVVLGCTPDELADMENFVDLEFVPGETATEGYGSEHLRMPVVLMTPVEHENVPRGELAIHRGANVFAENEQIGTVDEFLIKSKDDDHITHIVLREGHFWGKKNITIPVSDIEKFDDRGIHLKLQKAEVEELPSMKVHGWFS